MKIFLETPRLLIREMVSSDAESLFEMDGDPEVAKYIGDPLETVEQQRNIIEFVRKQYQDFGIGRWTVVLKSTDEPIGWCGLKWVTDNLFTFRNDYYDLGYRFKTKYWGQGFATEAGNACLQYGFEKMKLSSIGALAHHENKGSLNVLRKLGFQEDGESIEDDFKMIWFTLNQENFIPGQNRILE